MVRTNNLKSVVSKEGIEPPTFHYRIWFYRPTQPTSSYHSPKNNQRVPEISPVFFRLTRDTSSL